MDRPVTTLFLIQSLDGKISTKQLKEAIELAREATKKIYEVQKEALKDGVK